MSKYSLPHGTSASPLFMRNLIVWGLPLIGWLVLIVAWLTFSSSDDKAPVAEPDQPAQVAQPQPAGSPVAPAPAQTAPAEQATTQSTPQPAEVATLPQPAQPIVKTPYDFNGAVSKIGLEKESACNTGILVDLDMRKVLWAKNANRAVPIASMTKMMTMLIVEEAIAQGQITRETIIPVTKTAYSIGGSQVWLDPRESFPLNELMKAIAIKSANDAAFLVSEYLGNGDVNQFVDRMNMRARELGMNHSSFYDAHGLGDKSKRNNLSSAYDMAVLAERLLDYPEVMKLAATRMDTFRNGKTELRNHNNLVYHKVPGVDGLKTGFTNASGYCVTFTCKRGDRRLIGCVTGFKSAKDRDKFCRALLDWGYMQK